MSKKETARLVVGNQSTDIPNELLREVCMLLLGHIAPKRNYDNVTSVRKLIRFIEIEKELADESGSDVEEPKAKVAPVKRAAPVKKAVSKPVRKPIPTEDSEEESTSEDDEE